MSAARRPAVPGAFRRGRVPGHPRVESGLALLSNRRSADPLLTSRRPAVRKRSSSITSRSVWVELDLGLSFQMLEVLEQPRPCHWARIWPASIAMSRWLLAQAPGSLPTHATELGCGMGLVSLTLAHLGVITEGTDREPLALTYATENAARNGVGGFTASHLEWSEPSGASTMLVAASDVVYELQAPELIFSLLEDGGLLGRGGRFLLSVPKARTLLADELVSLLRAHGYAHAVEEWQVDWAGTLEPINLHVLTRPSSPRRYSRTK